MKIEDVIKLIAEFLDDVPSEFIMLNYQNEGDHNPKDDQVQWLRDTSYKYFGDRALMT